MPSPAPDRPLPLADAESEPLAFDVSVLEEFLGPDPALVATVLRTFFTSMGDSMVALRAALDDVQLARVATLAHRTKGAAFMSGALAMAQAAQGLEHAARSENGPATQLAATLLETRWQALQTHARLQSTLAGG